MWITKLHLRDIKSYGPTSPVIAFREGVNLIQGKNGAGKSTILEAIGLALFDSKPHTLGQFVREGARTGTIMVGFSSAVDEREYEVVRSIGASNQSYVHDPELNRKLCEGRDDTLAFIRQHLGVDQGTDLAVLFADAIGVPQGTMTAIFREPASQRKLKFNRLLHIDEYELVWNDLLKTGNYIRDLFQQNESQQSELRGTLHDKPEVEARVAALGEMINIDQSELARIVSELEAQRARLADSDALKLRLEGLQRRVRDSEVDGRQLEMRLDAVRLALAEAQHAADITAETEDSHAVWESAQAALLAAEQEREERDALLKALNTLKTERSVTEEAQRQVTEELERIAAAEMACRDLRPQVERYTALLEKREASRQASREYDQRRTRIEEQTSIRNSLSERFSVVMAELEAEGYALPQPVVLAGESLEMLAASAVMGAENALAAWRAARQTLEEINTEVVGLEQTLAVRVTAQASLTATEVERDQARSMIAALRGELDTLERDVVTLNEHEALLSETGAICPVCRQSVDSHAQAEAAAHYSAERDRLRIATDKARESLTEAERGLGLVEVRFKELAAQLASLAGSAELESARSRQVKAQQSAAEHCDRMQAACVEAAGRLAALDDLLDQAQESLETLGGQARKLEQLEAELAALVDPRQAFSLAEAEAARRGEVESRRDARAAEMVTIASDLDRAMQVMARYAQLDDRMKSLRQTQSDTAKAHERYVANRGLAAQVPERQETVNSLEREFETLKTARLEAVRERDEAAAIYDGETHLALQNQVRVLELQQVKMVAGLEGNRSALAEAQTRLDRLTAQAIELVAAEQTAGRLQTRQDAFEFVRQTIREAGPRVTQQLVRMISEQANHLFGDILGDHSLILNWSDDYAISVNNRGEERAFDLLSGGEQMVAALAVRLALLTQLANVRFAFFDEPTANLDDTRRQQLAERLADIHSLRQLFVISHDDTFEQESYHVIQVHKENEMSQVEIL